MKDERRDGGLDDEGLERIRLCLACGELVPFAERTCPACGHEEPIEGLLPCPGCGQAVEGELVFCPRCGLDRGPAAATVPATAGRAEPPASDTPDRVALGLTLLGPLVLAAAVGAVLAYLD